MSEVKLNETISNDICLYLLDGRCTNESCIYNGRHCVDNSSMRCVFFKSWLAFKAENEPKVTKPDQTNIISHPSHYVDGRKYEPKDVIRDWNLNFNLGSAVKYISRAGRKDDIIQDLKKAKQFIDFEIEALTEEREKAE